MYVALFCSFLSNPVRTTIVRIKMAQVSSFEKTNYQHGKNRIIFEFKEKCGVFSHLQGIPETLEDIIEIPFKYF